jgi:ribosomal protein L21E
MKKKNKIKKVMSEYKHGKLHSGSSTGKVVKKRSQAIAIAMSEAKKSKKKKK